jgi:hypothetical protein
VALTVNIQAIVQAGDSFFLGLTKKKLPAKPRAVAGNKAKPRTPHRTETATVNECDLCGKDLRDKQALKSRNERLIEDISDPDHNNYAEYLIRIGVLKRKISGGSVAVEGANAYAILPVHLHNCRLRGISFPRYLKASLKHHIRTGKPLSIEAYSNRIHAESDLKRAA